MAAVFQDAHAKVAAGKWVSEIQPSQAMRVGCLERRQVSAYHGSFATKPAEELAKGSPLGLGGNRDVVPIEPPPDTF